MYSQDSHVGGYVHIDDLSHEAIELLSKLSDPMKPEGFPYLDGGAVPNTNKDVFLSTCILLRPRIPAGVWTKLQFYPRSPLVDH